MRNLFLAFALLSVAALAPEIEGATASEWTMAAAACAQQPERAGCDALMARYNVVAPKVHAQMRTARPLMQSPDPAVVDRVLHATEHMAFSKEFGP